MVKNIRLFSFTEAGAAVAQRIAGGLDPALWQARCDSARPGAPGYTEGALAQWVEAAFKENDALVFVGACGIAVRAVAPWLRSKTTDPAVVVVDDSAAFAISLLSGHLGGANDLTRQIALLLGATPVITTATDRAGLLAVDEWAKSRGLAICGMGQAKAVSAALLAGETVGLQSDFPLRSSLPRGLALSEQGEIGIAITAGTAAPFEVTLRLVPPVVALGVGCRKGTTAAAIDAAVQEALATTAIAPQAVFGVFSVDIKGEEPGLLEFCRARGLVLQTFSARQLAQAPGEFSASAFVQGITGVDNVCERSAVLGSGGGQLLLRKYKHDGVTVAAALRDFTLYFDE